MAPTPDIDSQLALQSVTVELRRIRPERNEWRFYVLDVSVDLFGTVVLCRNWGRIGTGGRLRLDPHPDRPSAAAALEALAAMKRRRGYWDVARPGSVSLQAAGTQ